MLDTAAYAFVSTAYPEKVESVISIMEASTGIGNMLGPVLGSFVFEAVGFDATFWIFGGVMAPIPFLILIFLPAAAQVREG